MRKVLILVAILAIIAAVTAVSHAQDAKPAPILPPIPSATNAAPDTIKLSTADSYRVQIQILTQENAQLKVENAAMRAELIKNGGTQLLAELRQNYGAGLDYPFDVQAMQFVKKKD